MNFLAILACSATSLFAQEVVKQNELGGSLGWGNPFGISVEYARAVVPNQTVGAAVGFSMAGLRYGLDYKYFFNMESKFNPYLGLAGSLATGISEMNVSVNSDTAKYEIKGGTQITPRGGFRYRVAMANLYLNVGYGIPVSGGGVRYRSGSTKSTLKSAAEIVSLGGVEVSGSMFFTF